MKTPLLGFCLLLLILLFSSCSITSRKYMRGYSVEWKGKAEVHENIAINKSLEKAHSKIVALVNSNTAAIPVAKAEIAANVKGKNKNILTSLTNAIKAKTSLIAIASPASVVNTSNISRSPQEEAGNEFALKLARQSLLFGILACFVALAFVTVIIISIIHNAPALILYIVCLGVVSLTLALVAYFKGKRALPLLFGDDTAEKYYRMASLGRLLSYTIIIGLLLTLVIALAFFN